MTVNAEGAGGDASVRLLPQFRKQREQPCTHRREACDHGQLCALACMHASTDGLRSPKHKGKATWSIHSALRRVEDIVHSHSHSHSHTISPRHAKQLLTRLSLPFPTDTNTPPITAHSPMFAPTSQTTSPGRKLTPCWRYTLWVRMRDIVDRHD